MFLSIVIPTYNRAHLIENTLKSVLNQTCPDFEVILVDDGSTDNTQEVIAPYLSEKVRYYLIENSERGAARNRGTELANGHYLNWFDSDDEMLPDHVQHLRELCKKNSYPEVLNAMYQMKDAVNGKITPVQSSYRPNQKQRIHFLTEGNYLACNSVIVRKDIALENPFIEDRTLSASEDYELWLRLLAQYSFHQSEKITSYLIQHNERSVNTMTDPSKLEKRFLAFLGYMDQNQQFKVFLGAHYSYFVMRNYLVLAVDLACNDHKKLAFNYLKKAFKEHRSAVKQRVFWATLKHLLF
ncbi:glycosyltransferase family A protein [Fluviicola sp.]|jgi:glycosyltransferase involved in cell wall biosynthesis|uniref:glycosyltransferase family 2 protein n=1 Tax=Fluviicola sp. TaxID=1917219 RepID=UPI00282EFB00|nr:glycosyltransferase family A protein [Fluviicola sp.]MDR0801737.1 glycosyltransferase family 2 protein [Fluviicola sp.]